MTDTQANTKHELPPSALFRAQASPSALGAISETSWQYRHTMAWEFASLKSLHSCNEAAIRDAIVGWAALAEAHAMKHEAPIGKDGYLGLAWSEMGKQLLHMLNAELGRLDGGTLDKLIRDIAKYGGGDLEK